MSDDPRDTDELSVDDVAALFRSHAEKAPEAVTQRAIQRVRVESTATVLLRTLGGSWLRVIRALPDLAGASPRPEVPAADVDLEDTGELEQQPPEP